MRAIVRCFDGLLRQIEGIFEFTDDPTGLLRLQWSRARYPLRLSDGTDVERGDPVLLLHLWNEHIPPPGPGGPDLAWAVELRRRIGRSLSDVAGWLSGEPAAADVRALGGETAIIPAADPRAAEQLVRRLGFDVFARGGGPLARFGMFWENLYAWALMWTFNPAALRGRRFLELRRTRLWMSRRQLLARYGDERPSAKAEGRS